MREFATRRPTGRLPTRPAAVRRPWGNAGARRLSFVRLAWVVPSVVQCESWRGSTLQYGGTTRIPTRPGTDQPLATLAVELELLSRAESPLRGWQQHAVDYVNDAVAGWNVGDAHAGVIDT